MKKTRLLSATAAAAIVVVGVLPATSRNLAANFVMFGMGDSPVEVADGSIHGYVRGFNVNYWRKKAVSDQSAVYTAKAEDPDSIDLEGFEDASNPGAPAPSHLQGTGGWLILISNADPNGGNLNQNSISFCSTARESAPFCELGTPGTDKWIYLEAHPKQQYGTWEEKPLYLFKRLYFHDNHTGCDNGVCDHISQITIQTINTSGLPGPDGHSYKCSRVDQCKITIGGGTLPRS